MAKDRHYWMHTAISSWCCYVEDKTYEHIWIICHIMFTPNYPLFLETGSYYVPLAVLEFTM